MPVKKELRLEHLQEAKDRGPDPNIYYTAAQTYGMGYLKDEHGNIVGVKEYEYGPDGKGTEDLYPKKPIPPEYGDPKDYEEKLKEIDCHWLVVNSVNGTVYKASSSEFTFEFNYNYEVFYPIEYSEIKLDPTTGIGGFGDIVYIYQPETAENDHEGIVIGVRKDELGQGLFNGSHWGAQDWLQDLAPVDWDCTEDGIDIGYNLELGVYEVWQYVIRRPARLIWATDHVAPDPGRPGNPPKPPPRDPLLLDLDGGGIQTVGLDADIHFDSDADGFKELTGWVAPGDGMLMLDRNGNGNLDDGSELFGDLTILPDGSLSSNGFQALAYYDSTGDGRIDGSDTVWSQLKIWQVRKSLVETFFTGGEFADFKVVGQISSLESLGITAIYLDFTVSNDSDSSGNEIVRSGHFEWEDGSTGIIADYSLQRDTSDTIVAEQSEVPSDIAALPDLPGHGNLYDLHDAMVLDTSGELRALVEAFVAEEEASERSVIFDQIVFKWSGADSVSADSRGPFMDAREVIALETFFGEQWGNPDEGTAIAWTDTYQEIFEDYYGGLMAASHLQGLFQMITYVWDEEEQKYEADISGLVTTIQESLADNREDGEQFLAEFARSCRGLDVVSQEEYLSFRETFIEQDPDLAWVFDTGGLPVLEHPAPGTPGWDRVHLFGTHNAEAIKGDPADGYRVLHGVNGDDVVYGTYRNEWLRNQDGNAILVAGGGNDTIWAGDGADIIDGGEGNDILYGEAGDDTYIYRRGSGNDTIIDIDSTEGNIDTIWLGSSLTTDEVKLRRVGSGLVLEIIDTSETITVRDFFRHGSTLNRVERIQFMDGTTWEYEDIVQNAFAPTQDDDTIYGQDDTDDAISGLGGNDRIYGLGSDDTLSGDDGDDLIFGGAGSDILSGGTGNDILKASDGDDTLRGDEGSDTLFGQKGSDTLRGGTGADTLDGGEDSDVYLFDQGWGQDTIDDTGTAPDDVNTLRFGEGITVADFQTELIDDTDLKLIHSGTGDSILITNWLDGDVPGATVGTIEFADGSTWTATEVANTLLKPTEWDDSLYGFSTPDIIDGLGGMDYIHGRGGSDILHGGAGDDIVGGGAGDDTITGGDGSDRLWGYTGDDVIDSGPGNDKIYSGSGKDTFLFGRGHGQDEIHDNEDMGSADVGTILLADDITPDDVTLERTGRDLTLTIDDTGDTLLAGYWFWVEHLDLDGPQIAFADGTVWDVATIKQMLITGTAEDDHLVGYRTDDEIQGLAGNDLIHGSYGHDTLEGGAGSDEIFGGDGLDVLRGGDGADTLSGGSGDDILAGGAHNDRLFGGVSYEERRSPSDSNGNDQYEFGRGGGQDTILDRDGTAGNLDAIVLDADIVPNDVTIRRVSDNLVLSINDTTDSITVENWFFDESTEWQVEEIRFADGTTWDVDAIKQAVLQGTPDDDILKGYSTADIISGLAGSDVLSGKDGSDTLSGDDGADTLRGGDGNDMLLGGAGADTLEGGAGVDFLHGGAGSDTLRGGLGNDAYLLARGSDHDIVMDHDTTPGNLDTIFVDADITPADVTLTRDWLDLVVSIDGTSDSLTVENWFLNESSEYQVEEIRFTDGTTWDVDAIKDMVLQATPYDDALYGYSTPNTIDALAGHDLVQGGSSDDILIGGEGNDTITGGGGSDILEGGAGDDTVRGGSGDDTYRFGRDSGRDVIYDQDSTAGNVDTVLLDAGIETSDVTITSGGYDLFVTIEGSSARLKVTGWFANDAYKVEQIQFSDGTIWDGEYIDTLLTTPSGADDYLVGTLDEDVIDGGGGSDEIIGLDADDTLYGSAGDDILRGDSGGDTLDGGTDDDIIFGGDDADLLLGGDGRDVLLGQSGDDRLEGGDGHDVLDGGSGINILDGGPGYDEIFAEEGRNTIIINHGAGADIVYARIETPDTLAMVKDIYSELGRCRAGQLTDVAGTLYFSVAYARGEGYSYHLWKSDGTEAGTVRVGNASGSDPLIPFASVRMNDLSFFVRDDGIHGYELWKSDGTDAGIVMVKDVYPGSDSSWAQDMTDVNGTLFFAADDGVHGLELWKSDGTEAGTVMVKDINPDAAHGSPSYLTTIDSTVFFTADDGIHGGELWRSDGTEAGTVMVKDIAAGDASSSVYNLVDLDGTLIFMADDGVHGRELWRSDGTEAGTVMIKDINPDSWSVYPDSLAIMDGIVYFTANDGVHGAELWKTDGTEAGTVMVKDINPDSGSFQNRDLVNVDGILYFQANDGIHGYELWKSDGTEAGTVLVEDLDPGSYSTAPTNVTAVDGNLFFTVRNSSDRPQIWSLNLNPDSSNHDGDTVVFGPGFTPDNVTVELNVGDLGWGDYGIQMFIGTGEDNGVGIEALSDTGPGDFSASDLSVKWFEFDDGTVLSLDDMLARVDGIVGYQEGTEADDVLVGSVAWSDIYGLGGNDWITTFGGWDYVDGGDGDDVISFGAGDDYGFGGAGNDIIAGGAGADYLWDEQGNDVFVFNRGDGQDYLDHQASDPSDVSTLSFGVSITPENITAYIDSTESEYDDDGADLVLRIDDGSDTIRIWYSETLGGDFGGSSIKHVQFIDANGDAQVYDLRGIVEALRTDLESANADNPVALFTEVTQAYNITGTVPIAGGDHAVAYAQTGDLFAVPRYITGTTDDDVIDGGINNDTLEGGDGNDTITAGAGSDTISGGNGSDSLYGGSGDDVIDAGDGTDFIDAGAGDDIIAGLQGGDTASGGSGDDTYHFNLGDGVVSINDIAEAGAGNTIVFGDGITPDALEFIPNEDAMTVIIGDAGDAIVLTVFDPSDTLGTYAVETFRFADGTEYTFAELLDSGFDLTGTEGEDLLQGTSLDDRIQGLGGDDLIIGRGGSDLLSGGSGDDTYIFNLGDGVDTIRDGVSPGAGNSIVFGMGITSTDLTLKVVDGGMLIEVGSSGDAIFFEGIDPEDPYNATPLGGFNPDDPYNTMPVETFRFADGTVLAAADLLDMGFTFEGTPQDDSITGTAAPDLIAGNEGTDAISGGAGDDTYRYHAGDGVDIISDVSTPMEPNMLILGPGITADAITLSHDPANETLILNMGAAGDAIHFTGFDASDPYGAHAVEYFLFDDGQILTYSQIIDRGFDIEGSTGDDTLIGTAIEDRISGGDGADTLTGGAGSDRLSGGAGDDTYHYNAGDGIDYIEDTASVDEANRLVFGEDVSLSDIENRLSYDGDNLIIRVGENTGDEVHLSGFDPNAAEAGTHAVEVFEFADGTILNYEELVRNTFIVQGGSADDDITGTNVTDRLYGYEGFDRLSAGYGDDVLTGGINDDELIGGDGSDIYVFNLGDGVDTIYDSSIPEEGNLILFGEGITIDDLSATIDGTTLVIEYGSGGDTILLPDYDYNAITGSHVVETIEFSDGTQVHLNSIVDPGTEGDDYILGSYFEDAIDAKGGNDTVTTYESNDIIQGGSGDDIINAGAGDDLIIGGTGSDTLNGGEGYDTYVFNPGDGVDTVTDSSAVLGEGNMIRFGDGVTADDISLSMDGTTLVIQYTATGDAIRLPDFDYNQLDGSQVVGYMQFADGSGVRLADMMDPGTEGDDLIVGSYFEDTIDAKGGNDTVTTLESSDTIIGGSGNDIIDAGAGYDEITAGTGNDTVTGGPGHDTYFFNPGDGVDTIDDFATEHEGNRVQFGDGITLDDLTLSHEDTTLIVNVGTNGDALRLEGFDPLDALGPRAVETFGFADGTESLYDELIARGFDLVGTPGDDTMVGTNVDDRILGLAGNDSITAGDGNDTVDGGAGADTLTGGLGDDTYLVDNAGDLVVENVDEGVDVVQSSISHTLGENVESLVLTGDTAIDGTGNDLDNTLTGNSNDNVLDGGAGSDTMQGAAGNDTYIVDSLDDVIEEQADEGVDTVQSPFTYTLGNHIENLTLVGLAAIAAYGNDLDNALAGNAADNTLDGGAGSDTLHGMDGDDIIIAGPGSDALHGGAGDDTYAYHIGDGLDAITEISGTDTILFGTGITSNNLSVSEDASGIHVRIVDDQGNPTGDGLDIASTMGEDPTVEFFQFADGTTEEVKDYLVNIVEGTDGPDWIETGEKKDIIYAKGGWDHVSSGGNDDIIYGGSGSDWLDGQAANDILYGESGWDVLTGGSGHDYLDGGSGVDLLIGGSGDDTYVVDSWCDRIVESCHDGTDTVYSSTSYSLSRNVENLILTGDCSSKGRGNSSHNSITGNNASNKLYGEQGNDILAGAGGSDRLYGDSGSDILDGGSDSDKLYGGTGSDTYLFGIGSGQDYIDEERHDWRSVDVLSFGPGITQDDVSFSRSGRDLVVGINGTQDRVTIEDWYQGYGGGCCEYQSYGWWGFGGGGSAGNRTIEKFTFDDGTALLNNQVDAMVSAMGSFCPPRSCHSSYQYGGFSEYNPPWLSANFR